jgi:hypothetical protein
MVATTRSTGQVGSPGTRQGLAAIASKKVWSCPFSRRTRLATRPTAGESAERRITASGMMGALSLTLKSACCGGWAPATRVFGLINTVITKGMTVTLADA